MRKAHVRQIGECTECGQPATHSHECVLCHTATLSIVAIKGKYGPDELKEVGDGLSKSDLYAVLKSKEANSAVMHVALVITRLASANKLNLSDVKRVILSRLNDDYMSHKNDSEETKAAYMKRVIAWVGTLTKWKEAKQ